MMSTDQDPTYVFREGDQVLVIDRKGRSYLATLDASAEFQSHIGTFAHTDLIGREEGTRVTTGTGHSLLAFRPTLAEYTRQMPRIATVVYPKDLGALLVYGDIFPGARVLEAGARARVPLRWLSYVAWAQRGTSSRTTSAPTWSSERWPTCEPSYLTTPISL